MDGKVLTDMLQDKDDKKAYSLSQEIGKRSEISDEFYEYFNDFLTLISSKSSFVKTRGFFLCCSQAKWDTEGKLYNAIPEMMKLLHDEKPTVVRQSLKALENVVECRPELKKAISDEIEKMDISKYKDSMIPLLIKDISSLKDKLSD